LIVGERDPEVIRLNRAAFAELTVTRDLAIVPGASHLFEEPGALEQVAGLARDWFAGHLVSAAASTTLVEPPDAGSEAAARGSGT
jgi:hypothetical protein